MDISRDAKDGMVPITVTGTPDMVKSGDIRCHTRARARRTHYHRTALKRTVAHATPSFLPFFALLPHV